MKKEDDILIVFVNNHKQEVCITITVEELLTSTLDDFYEKIADVLECGCSNCHNESQNFCDCIDYYQEYIFYELRTNKINK